MNNINIITELPINKYSELLNLIHESFETYKKQGIFFTCSNYNIEDLKNKVLSNKYFIAISNKNELLGITAIKLNDDNTAYECITAIKPQYKSSGIGTLLYNIRKNYLKKIGINSLISDTSVKAEASVKWHLNKCCCKKIGYISFPSTNYYSYILCEDFTPPHLLKRLNRKIHYIYSVIKCHILWKENGKQTFINKLICIVK